MSAQKNVEVLPDEFATLMERAVGELGIFEEKIATLKSVKAINNEGKSWQRKNSGIVTAGTLFLLLVVFPALFYRSARRHSTIATFVLENYFSLLGTDLLEEPCLILQLELTMDAFRPPVECSECENVTGIHIVKNLSQSDFLEKYAFTMQPVLIKDGQDGWSAKEKFNFDFFREVYKDGSEALKKTNKDCQFFPYQTEFDNLDEMLNMSRDRVEGKEEPWYVGWSNCDGKAANILRKHYKFPYFLPPELDHSKTDWIFMGLPGYGANLHIDSVGASTWQAQVKGTKKWTLEAPPECAGTCIRRMEIIVEPGDIIVLDGDKWYHATFIMGNDTSIVIGSEYF